MMQFIKDVVVCVGKHIHLLHVWMVSNAGAYININNNINSVTATGESLKDGMNSFKSGEMRAKRLSMKNEIMYYIYIYSC